MKYFILCFISIACFSQAGVEIKSFTTDGCSVFPDGNFEENKLWLLCCTAHDFSYWKGGTYEERVDADIKLRACVKQVGEPAIADLMLTGVRIGGSPYFPTKFRWGYGWPYPRGYKAITATEKKEIDSKLDDITDEVILRLP